MYENHLTQAGLLPEQAEIYEILAKNGPLKASEIDKKTPLKRGLVYKTLDRLIELDLIEKEEKEQQVAVFHPKHPLKLKDLVEKREREAKDAQIALSGVMSGLTSDFNLAVGRPGIQFFEGIEGLKQVWWDSLQSKTTIYTYDDLEVVIKKFSDINKEYVKERIKREIRKKAITNDSPFNRKILAGYDSEFTETRLISGPAVDFSSTIMEIYDGKVSYTTIDGDKIFGVIIDNPQIYEMQRSLFEHQWKKLEGQTVGESAMV